MRFMVTVYASQFKLPRPSFTNPRGEDLPISPKFSLTFNNTDVPRLVRGIQSLWHSASIFLDAADKPRHVGIRRCQAKLKANWKAKTAGPRNIESRKSIYLTTCKRCNLSKTSFTWPFMPTFRQ